jgi:3-hydroxyisobutyryl-CoA hydrolase
VRYCIVPKWFLADVRASELGLATHYVPSNRIPQLLTNLAALDNPTHDMVDSTIEELYEERGSNEPPPAFVGYKREALDAAFSYNEVERIVAHLKSLANDSDATVVEFSQQTLAELHMCSPTSLKVALQAIRLGKNKTLKDCLRMELCIASALCVSHFQFIS